MATNFKITGGASKGNTKSHYVVERQHEKAEHNEITRLAKKLEKHIDLPMDKAHSDQSDAPLPSMRKY